MIVFLFVIEHSAYQSRHCPYLDTIDRYTVGNCVIYSECQRQLNQNSMGGRGGGGGGLKSKCCRWEILWESGAYFHRIFLFLLEIGGWR